jgi:hypothetical protein
MPKPNEHLKRKYEAIREDFKALSALEIKSGAIYRQLGAKYYYAPITVEDIVWERGIYAEEVIDEDLPVKPDPNPSQMTIFDVTPKPKKNEKKNS